MRERKKNRWYFPFFLALTLFFVTLQTFWLIIQRTICVTHTAVYSEVRKDSVQYHKISHDGAFKFELLSNVTVLEIHIKEVSKLFSRMNQKQNYFYNIKARSRFSILKLNTFPTVFSVMVCNTVWIEKRNSM